MDKKIQLLKEIDTLRKQQQKLSELELELCKQYIQINDKKEWYTESKRTVGHGKNKRTFLEGRFHWIQKFKDPDTGNEIEIERSRPVKENDKWDNIAITSLVI